MTVLTTTSDIQYAGLTGQDTFVYNFRVDLITDMFPTIDGAPVAQGTFTMTGLGTPSGGNVVLDTPLVANGVVILARSVNPTQEVDYQPFDAFPAETHEGTLDKLTMLIQQSLTSIGRALRFPIGDSSSPLLPDAATRANSVLSFDSAGDIELGVSKTFTDAEKTKLAGIEDNADVTDSVNVAAAGAVMDTDFSIDEAILMRTALGTYISIKNNRSGASPPGASNDINEGYYPTSTWADITNGDAYTCVSNTAGAAAWVLNGTTGGAITSVAATLPLTSTGGSTPTIALPNLTAIGEEINDLDRVANNVASFLPFFTGDITPGSPVGIIQSGIYLRVGNVVHVALELEIGGLGGMVGRLLVSGLPFNFSAVQPPAIPVNSAAGFSTITASETLYLTGQTNDNTASFIGSDIRLAVGLLNIIDVTDLIFNTNVKLNFSYLTDDPWNTSASDKFNDVAGVLLENHIPNFNVAGGGWVSDGNYKIAADGVSVDRVNDAIGARVAILNSVNVSKVSIIGSGIGSVVSGNITVGVIMRSSDSTTDTAVNVVMRNDTLGTAKFGFIPRVGGVNGTATYVDITADIGTQTLTLIVEDDGLAITATIVETSETFIFTNQDIIDGGGTSTSPTPWCGLILNSQTSEPTKILDFVSA